MTKSAAFHYVGAAFAAWGAMYTGQWHWITMALANAHGAEKQRKARNQARDAYNASLQDRMVMTDLQPDAPRTLVLGRVRAVEGVRRRWASGTHNENLTLIVSFAGHEIDAFETFWFNDIPLRLDGSGYIVKPAQLTGCSAVRSGTTAILTKTAHGIANGERVTIAGFSLPEFNGTFAVFNSTANTFSYAIPNAGVGDPPGTPGTVDVVCPYFNVDNATYTLTGTLDGSGNAAVTLTGAAISGTLSAIYSTGTGDASNQNTLTVTLDSGLDYDLSGGPAGADYVVSWQSSVGIPLARIRTYLGTDAQNVGDDLAAEYPGHLTDTDAFAGIALAVVDLNYSEDAFPQGVPNITATMRGAKCLDPRDDSTAWTENPALHAYHYAMWEHGWRVPVDEIREQDVIDAADICDTSTTFTLGVDDVTMERYRCGIVISSASDPRQSMGDIMETMAGRWGWSGGVLRMRCGTMAAPLWTLDSSWIAQQIGQDGQPSAGAVVRISNGVAREEKINHVAGTCIDPDQRYQALPYPAVRDDVLIAADGAEYRLEAVMSGVNHIAHAQHLSSILIREGQAPLRMDITSNLSAYPLELFDVGEVTLARYGMTAKTMEVIGWRWRPAEGVQLRLAEITEAIYEPVDTLNGRDPAPNGNLHSPWDVEQIEGVAVTSDADIQPDGAVLTQTTIEWDAVVSQAVLNGGRIEVQFTRADNVPATGDWASWIEQGGAVSATIPGLPSEVFFLFRVRAINSLGVRGRWSAQVLHKIGTDTTGPEDVADLDHAIKPGQVVITCTPCVARDYAFTELRYLNTVPDYDSGDWAAATFLVRGASNEYHHPRPPNGTYYVLAKHADRSGNYSAGTAYETVVVDDSIDSGAGGGIVLRADRFPFFSFADGTTHTAQAPGDTTITFTAYPIGQFGTASFVAEAFNSSNVSLGTLTMGGSGNARTLTAAQFVSLGSSGSVRTLVVTATLGTASDAMTVYRQDSTTTAPRLYLDNPTAAVQTDEAGDYGDYSDVLTGVFVYAGLTDDTASYTFSITPDSGVTSTINGGAGPVSGTGTVTVAVSDMTIPDGAVLIGATGPATLSASFLITKDEASGAGYTAYFEPRSEIVLPVLNDGSVASYVDAWSTLKIIKGGSIDDTAQWSLTKVDTNVTSTLTGARVDVTDWPDLGETGSTVSASNSLASGWTRGQSLTWGDGVWIWMGYHASTSYQYIKRSTDFATWTDVDVGVSGFWGFGAYGNDRFILINNTGGVSNYIESTDGGLTWSTGALGVSRQWIDGPAYGAGRWMLPAYGTTSVRTSTNDGGSWSDVTLPSAPEWISYAGPVWVTKSTSTGNAYTSTNGTSWSSVVSALAGVSMVRTVAGRAVALFSSGTTAKYSDTGSTWVSVTLPQSCTLAWSQVVRGVLYIVGTDGKVQFTQDGKTWVYNGGTASAAYSFIAMRDLSIDIDDDAWSGLETSSTGQHTTPLLATSASAGAVTVTATKTGEQNIVRALPVRKGGASTDVYTSYASPAMLLLPATSDGVVTSYAGATMTAYVNRNAVDDTGNWTWSYVTTYLTPSSGSSNSVTLTDMDDAQDQGTITFTATKPGQATITGTLLVNKMKGPDSSGIRIGAGFTAIDTANTWIGLKFVGDGRFQVKRGSGGSYVDAGTWAGVVTSANASTYWLQVIASGHALTSGTTDTWLAMTTDREYVLSDAASGTHRTDLQVLFATSSGGANAVLGYGALQLIVP